MAEHTATSLNGDCPRSGLYETTKGLALLGNKHPTYSTHGFFSITRAVYQQPLSSASATFRPYSTPTTVPDYLDYKMFGSSDDRAKQLAARHRKKRVISGISQASHPSTANPASQRQQQQCTADTLSHQSPLYPDHHPLSDQTDFIHYVQPRYDHVGQDHSASQSLSRSSLRAQQFQMDQHRIQNEYMSHILYGNHTLPNLLAPPRSNFPTISHPAAYLHTPPLATSYQWLPGSVDAEPLMVNMLKDIKLENSPVIKVEPESSTATNIEPELSSHPQALSSSTPRPERESVSIPYPPHFRVSTLEAPLRTENTRIASDPSPNNNVARTPTTPFAPWTFTGLPRRPEAYHLPSSRGQLPTMPMHPIGFYSATMPYPQPVQRHVSQPLLSPHFGGYAAGSGLYLPSVMNNSDTLHPVQLNAPAPGPQPTYLPAMGDQAFNPVQGITSRPNLEMHPSPSPSIFAQNVPTSNWHSNVAAPQQLGAVVPPYASQAHRTVSQPDMMAYQRTPPKDTRLPRKSVNSFGASPQILVPPSSPRGQATTRQPSKRVKLSKYTLDDTKVPSSPLQSAQRPSQQSSAYGPPLTFTLVSL